MGDIFSAVILGIIEGLTEFLPISSTGHLILVNNVVDFTGNFAAMFNVVIQFGAILSVILYFRDKLNPFGRKSVNERKEILNLWKKTMIGIIPAIIMGVLVWDYVEEKLFTPLVVAIALIVGGIVLIWIESQKRTAKINSIAALTYQTAFLIGAIQCIAMIPGVSRSASTIIGAMLLGASRVVAAEFSFFLAIPTMAAASGYTLLKMGLTMTTHQLLVLAVGFIVSFLTAFAVIAAFMSFIRKTDFKPFGWYRIVLGILVLILL